MSFGQWIKYFFLIVFLPNSIRRMEWQMLIYLNRDRKDFGLVPLFMQADLREVARKHSKDMVKQDYFAHENIKGQSPSDRLKVSRVTDSVSGENLAKIGGYEHPVFEAEAGLMRSPGHRANILNKSYNCVGIGIHKSEDGIYYYTQNFAKRVLKFTRKIHKTVSIKKGLRLKGYPIENDILFLFYQVKLPGILKPIKSGQIPITDKGFDYVITFNDVGKYEVSIFVPSMNKDKLTLVNSFDVRVRRWWFWR